MTKRILLSTVVAATLATSALAENTFGDDTKNGVRLDGMGLSNYQTKDVYNIFANPAAIMKHKGTAIAEMNAGAASVASVMGGAIYDTGSGVVGIFTGRTDTSGMAGAFTDTNQGFNLMNAGTHPYQGMLTGLDSATNAAVAAVASLNAPIVTDIFYGMDLGSMDLGVRFTMGQSGSSATDNTYTAGTTTADNVLDATEGAAKINAMSLDVGVAMKNISAGVQFNMTSASYLANLTTTTTAGGQVTDTSIQQLEFAPTGGLGMVVHGQYDLELSKGKNLLLTAAMNINNMNTETKASMSSTLAATDDSLTTLTENKSTSFLVNAALNLKPSADTNVVIAAGVNFGSGSVANTNTSAGTDVGVTDTDETTFTSFSIPLNVAFEQKASDKFTWRVGTSGTIMNTSGGEYSQTTNTVAGTVVTPDVLQPSDTNGASTNTAAAIFSGVTYTVTKDLALNGVVSQQWIISGPALIGSGTQDLFAAASLTYSY